MNEFTRDEIDRLRDAVKYALRMEVALQKHSCRPTDKQRHFEEAQEWNALLGHVMRLRPARREAS